MAYVKPEQVLESMIQTGVSKANLSVKHLLIRGFLGGAILACATTLAFTATVQTKLGIVGALVFPAGFVMIILLGLELVTGSFALVPLGVLEGKTSRAKMISSFFWVIVGHLIGCLFYAVFYYIAVTGFGHSHDNGVIQMIVNTAEAKTIGYKKLGMDGLITVFVKAILCNWMVTLGAVMAMTSKSTLGKIAAMWLPLLIFFAQGFEHAVVNLFVIPAGMMFGAKVTFADWWLWNQIPVLIGNLIGGFTLTGLFLYLTHRKKTELLSTRTENQSASAGLSMEKA
ncbi:MAG: formate/nitrite transporter [Paenibacillaceae bacterium]|jgi:formate/nitrite transporter|nr:formate/nitrite transporter [Paenibacillaceae bacterium]